MSASPAQAPSGPASTTSAGGTPVPIPRKKAPVSIFTLKKRPVKKTTVDGKAAAKASIQRSKAQQRGPNTTNGTGAAAQAAPPENQDFTEFPIYISKDALMAGLHHHAMKLHSRPGKDGMQMEINPYLEGHFTRPVRLHRRNARDKMEVADQSDAASGMDDKERELINMKRAERQAEKDANQALIAPTGGDPKKPAKRKPQKKVEEVYYDESDPKQRRRQQLRYEEARPWHLEDFDGKNIWVGSYEEPLSETSVLFEIGQEGFRMIPVEKWYKFTQANRVNAMDSDAVERHMSKKVKAAKWTLGTQLANDEARKQLALQKREEQQARTRGGENDDAPDFVKTEEYRADVDEIDFEFNDEFQDDDEGLIFGDQGDDDAKEIERKIREEMRGANLAGTGVKDEDKDWDEEEQKERQAEQEEKRKTKRIRKQLIKKERKNEYDSDSDRGEFSESSDSEDTEEERERLEEERKQEEQRKHNGDKSGTSTKGTNTPMGRAEKKDTSRLGASLKRPGSPDLSEISGNESNKKKAKGANGRAMSRNPPRAAGSLSPDAAKSNNPHRTGSGSDTDTSRQSRRKIRLKNSPPGSPVGKDSPPGSRQASPSGSRAQSPQRKAMSFPSLDEVREAIPIEGIGIADLVNTFRGRTVGKQREFIALVKEVGKQDPSTKKIFRKLVEAGAASPSAA